MKPLRLPPDPGELAGLTAGDEVSLTGDALTLRDAALGRVEALLQSGEGLPFDLDGQLVFHAGPSPPAAGRPCGAVGPTTSARMDSFLPALFELGVRATLGKGPRGEEARALHEKYRAVYLVAVGGAGALLARCVEELEVVAWEDLGAEAVHRLGLREFPAVVAIDSRGRDYLAEQYRRMGSHLEFCKMQDSRCDPGLFITFEGCEGSGKTTQMDMLREHLESRGMKTVSTIEPGGTPVGERTRDILLDPASGGMSALTEALLFAADRAEQVERVIRPALERGAIVLCDRFTDSSIAYQGIARGLGMEEVLELNRWATGGLEPALTFYLDMPPAEALKRKHGSEPDRIEDEPEEFHERVREAYRKLVETHPERIVTVDAGAAREEVHRGVVLEVEKLLSGGGQA